MRICSVASGSSGNCIYVGSDNTHVIIDAGISGKRIEEGLNQIGLSTSDLSAILITHEHSDHIASIGVLSRKYAIPMYATKGTIEGIMNQKYLGSVDASLFNEIKAENDFSIEDLHIRPIEVSHDALEPVAYRIANGNRSVGVCTDLGTYNEKTVEGFSGVDVLFLEANHDVRMLQVGRYPYYLKQRILSDKGHLSNENCGRLLCRLLHDDMRSIVLGHLSAENNLAELAYEAVRLEIMMDECKYEPSDFEIRVARRDEVSQLTEVC
ncbi:MAG: MBL fold metallo-hydrolase [Lachnospiraceae bacterium]|nr:MBL fold metallo-hydrolase [Lachnospiraceae bacterium]